MQTGILSVLSWNRVPFYVYLGLCRVLTFGRVPQENSYNLDSEIIEMYHMPKLLVRDSDTLTHIVSMPSNFHHSKRIITETSELSQRILASVRSWQPGTDQSAGRISISLTNQFLCIKHHVDGSFPAKYVSVYF